MSALLDQVVDAFNRHGSFTARVIEHGLAVEIRHIDSGERAATLWLPDDIEGWLWFTGADVTLAGHAGSTWHEPRNLPRRTGVDDVIAAVAASIRMVAA